jgi:hypothetical protein
MTFSPNIPQTGQSLGQTRDPIRNNFTNYSNTISQDHVGPNGGPGPTVAGKHNKSTYVVQSADPVTIADEIASYSKSIAGVAQLFLEPASAGTPIQMSRLDTGVGVGSSGFSFLPGGVIIQWKAINNVSNGTPITFPITFPNEVFVIIPGGGTASGTQPTINFDQTSITLGGFRAAITGTQPINYYFIAIGN